MAKLKIELDLDNDAFQDGKDLSLRAVSDQVVQLGRKIARSDLLGVGQSKVLDINGNTVGTIEVEG